MRGSSWGAFGVTLFGIFLRPVFFYVIRGLLRGRIWPIPWKGRIRSWPFMGF
jgi:hypothetical protein